MTSRINSLNELQEVKKRQAELMALRLDSSKKQKIEKREILVCVGGGCLASGALDICKALRESIAAHKIENLAVVVETGCMGPCAAGPVARVMPDNVFYQGITPDDAVEIIEKHIVEGNLVTRLLHHDSESGRPVAEMDNIGYFKKQTRIALERCGTVDPFEINEYIAVDGYQGLAKAITALKPSDIIETVLASGLRGRGGGGFPTGLKWKFTAASPETPKNVVCNADEGDPGAFMDRSMLEGDPHSIIE
ncbi:MAG: NAD(P)H-dependent oxidoreductase subunit E, partial [Candidatus Riflebacteria bacterium]|nr:NAD(P)H-dependent oxidoreductase subunit E [Candidatus Riflebacteria bacterium]